MPCGRCTYMFGDAVAEVILFSKCIGETGRNHATKRTQTSYKKRWPQQQRRRTPLKTSHTIRLGLCYVFNLQYSTTINEVTLESWFINDYLTGNSNTLFIIYLRTRTHLHSQSKYVFTNGYFMFWIFNWLSFDPEDGFHAGCRKVIRKQQTFSGLQSPRWSI